MLTCSSLSWWTLVLPLFLLLQTPPKDRNTKSNNHSFRFLIVFDDFMTKYCSYPPYNSFDTVQVSLDFTQKRSFFPPTISGRALLLDIPLVSGQIFECMRQCIPWINQLFSPNYEHFFFMTLDTLSCYCPYCPDSVESTHLLGGSWQRMIVFFRDSLLLPSFSFRIPEKGSLPLSLPSFTKKETFSPFL